MPQPLIPTPTLALALAITLTLALSLTLTSSPSSWATGLRSESPRAGLPFPRCAPVRACTYARTTRHVSSQTPQLASTDQLRALPQVAKSMPGLAGGAVFGALLGYRIG